MAVFIICHQDLPYYRPPEGSYIVWLNARRLRPEETGGATPIQGYDWFENPEALHEMLSGTLGTMVIRKFVEAMSPRPELVTIWQYRKFMLFQRLGVEADNFPGMWMVPPADKRLRHLPSPEAGLLANTQLPVEQKFMLAARYYLQNMAEQYAAFTHILDLFRFTTVALEIGVLTKDEVLSFFNRPHVVPGGLEMGTYPTGWWLHEIDSLIRASLAYRQQYSPVEPGHPYHKRAAAFCCERLGSHAVLKACDRLFGGALPADLQGTMHTVSDLPGYTVGI
jgi:hypothetical protein